MKSKKRKNTMVIVILCIIAIGIIGALSEEEPANTEPKSSEIETTTVPKTSESETTTVPETSEVETTTIPKTSEVETTEPENETSEHRTGEEIIGISDKNISDLHVVFYDSVIDDVTGNWRLAVISENVNIRDYIFSYYKKYIKSNDEIHGIVNLGRNVTTRINKIGNWLMVSEYEYVEGEEHSAKLLYSGKQLDSYIVYTDNGDIESAEE